MKTEQKVNRAIHNAIVESGTGNGGDIKWAKIDILFSDNGKTRYLTLKAENKLYYPKDSGVGFVSSDIQKSVHVIQYDSKMRTSGIIHEYNIFEPMMNRESRHVIEIMTLLASFSLNELNAATARRRAAVEQYREDFCLDSMVS